MMLARVTKDIDGLPEGSILQDADARGDYVHGLWCSMFGSYRVSVPASLCEVFDASELNPTFKQDYLGEYHSSRGSGEADTSARIEYVTGLCHRLGLDPATQPLQLVTLQGKMIAYAGRGCAAQLNQLHGLSHAILSQEKIDDVYIVTDRCTGNDGRVTEEIGVVSVAGLKGDMLANAFMKARTKAMRRATPTHVGLGMLDEQELETIKDVTPVKQPVPSVRMKEQEVDQPTNEWTHEERMEAKTQVGAYCEELIQRGYSDAEAGSITKKVYDGIGDPETSFDKWGNKFVAWCERADKKHTGPVSVFQGGE